MITASSTSQSSFVPPRGMMTASLGPQSDVVALKNMTGSGGGPLAELVGALSLGIDLGFGQPMEHVLRQCLIALRIAERIGLDEQARAAVYYTALLVNVGCHSDAHEQAKWFGDDIAVKATRKTPDGRPSCEDFYVTNCTFKHGHGLSIGGQTNLGLNGLTATNITFDGTTTGIRMKASRIAGGLVQNCTYSNITMYNVQYPININSYYLLLNHL